MLSGAKNGKGTPHDKYNIRGIAPARTNRKDDIFMQSQLVQNFTFILEWGQGTCSLTKHTRPVFFPSMLPTPLCANFVNQSVFLKTFFFVKLHFELADLIQLKLVRVEVNLVFPCHNKNSNNPHLTSKAKHAYYCVSA